MASLSFEQEQLSFQTYYRANYQTFLDAEVQFRTLIASLLAQVGSFAEVPKVISRVKAEAECVAKFQRKYQTALEKQQVPYEIRDYITDLLGVRVTCLYESEILEVARVLAGNFKSLSMTDKIAKLESTDDAFGYRGLHLDLAINNARSELPEYMKYRDFHLEVQIRTIIQDGWSILDHKMKYKRAIPTALKRRINVLAALFELADHEFMAIREATKSLEQRAREQLAAETSIDSMPADTISRDEEEPFLNVFQFREIASAYFPHYTFWPEKTDGFVQELLKWKPSLTAKEFDRLLRQHLPVIERYADYSREQRSFYLNPFTQMRHALFLSDQSVFHWMLYDVQRHSFREWLQLDRQSVDRRPVTVHDADWASGLVRDSLLQHSRGRYAEGIVLAEKAISFDPMLSGAWRSLAMNLTQLGEHERAREAWRTSDGLTSNGPIDYTQAAVDALQKVRADGYSSMAWEHFARIMEREGRACEAIVEARAMLLACPEIHTSLVPLVEYLVSHCPGEAAALLSDMLGYAPAEAHYVHLYGISLRKASADLEAIPHLRASAEAVPSNSNYWYALGRALEDTGDITGACEAFRTAVGCQSTPHRKAEERLSALDCAT